MQTVVIVNLNGIAYHIEEGAFAALGTYIERAERQLAGNPDQPEIVADLEQAIADKFPRYLGAHKNVVTGADMATILEEMGPVHDEGATATGAEAQGDADATQTSGAADTGATSDSGDAAGTAPKRLYLMLDGGIIGGVCSGMAAFADIDVTLLRVVVTVAAVFELGLLHTPLVVLAYVVLMFVIPVADTSEERAAARGIPFSAQQLIDEAKANFSRIGEHDWKSTRREWRKQRRWERKFERQRRRSYSWTWPPPAAASGSYGAQVATGALTPLLTLMRVALFWLAAFACLSVAFTGGIFSWPVPPNVPLWLSIVGIVVAYSFMATPLQVARRMSYQAIGGRVSPYAAIDSLLTTLLGIAIVWGAYHYSPEVREWLRHLPTGWHNVAASFRP